MAATQTIFEQLAPYAAMTVVPGVTVSRLAYANQMDLTSDSVFNTSLKTVPANQELQFVNAALTEVGQGWTGGLTLKQTNSKFSKGQPPANQCLIATHLSMGVYYVNSKDPSQAQQIALPSARDLFALIQNFSWDLQIGRGISRTIGSLLEYPDAGGVWSETRDSFAITNLESPPDAGLVGIAAAQNGVPGCVRVKLPIPIIFPPLVNVGLTAKCGNAFDLQDLDSAVASPPFDTNIVVRMTLGSFLMTMPV